MRESKRGQRQRAQVMVLSCRCHRQTQAAQPPGCHLHLTQYPLYSQYHASLFRCGRLPWCGRLTAPFLPPKPTSRQLPPVTPPVIPAVCCALPAQTVLSALFCLSLLFSFCPTWALGLCIWHALCLLPSAGLSYGVLPLKETLKPFQERGALPTQKPASKFSCRPVFFFLSLLPSCDCACARGPGSFTGLGITSQTLFRNDGERVTVTMQTRCESHANL